MPSNKSFVMLLLFGCNGPIADFRDSAPETTITTTSSSTTSSQDATTDPESPDTTTGDSTTGTSTTGTTGQVEPLACDPWLEDCPEGQKCISHAGDGGWQAPTCSPLVAEPDAVGEPCSVDPIDSCDPHAMCWHVDPDTGLGTCRALCAGTASEPVCDAGELCLEASFGNLAVCLPACSPIDSACAAGEVCVPRPNDGTVFVCVPDISGEDGQAFDDCEYSNACDPGLGCMNVALASDCDPGAVGCCLPFCDLTQPNTCPGQGLECLAWYEPGYEPPGLEDVGLCAVMP